MIRRLKRRLSKTTTSPDRQGAHAWDADRAIVASTGLPFRLKYLGSAEVPEARGIDMCEMTVASFHPLTATGKKKMILTVSTEGIRVVDESSHTLVFDQPIEKVSFCAPSRNYERCFSYIARDGATRKWICHCFVTILPVTGERLSHAVGAAFSLCLQKRQQETRNRSVRRQASLAGEMMTDGRTGPSRSSSVSARSAASAPSVPTQRLEELYATVNKPRRVSAVNENNEAEGVTTSQQPELLLQPSATITPVMYRREPPQSLQPQRMSQMKPNNVDPWDIVSTPPPGSYSDPWQVQLPNTQQQQQHVTPLSLPQQQAVRQSTSRGPRPPSGNMESYLPVVATAGLVDTTTLPPATAIPLDEPWIPRERPPLRRRPSKADEWLDNMVAHSVVEAARRSTSPPISEDLPSTDTTNVLPTRIAQQHGRPDPFSLVSSQNQPTQDPFQSIGSQLSAVPSGSVRDPFQPMQTDSSGNYASDGNLNFHREQPSLFEGGQSFSLVNGFAEDDIDQGRSPWLPQMSQRRPDRSAEEDDWQALSYRHLRSEAFPDSRVDQFS